MKSMPKNVSLEHCDSAEHAAKEVYDYLQTYVQVLGYGKNNVTLYQPGDYATKCWTVEISIDKLAGWTNNIKYGQSGQPEIMGFRENENIAVRCKNIYALEFYDI